MQSITKMYGNKKKGLCPFCEKKVDINDLKDEISKQEFAISGLCQKCQDEFFME